ncbi:hypothetical protein GALMADRAFT_148472 [Galerina marginata CBS 339.88]|uniref:Uncharacterized protein n=1 Tax=Galerina marginata (strain CBS 339.88) TaxID=685588 RepID=A0A067S730_GALM3|nr:hypothetical protein GALMADRAFT_148472 [Galerina marginata CBS 339.88]
MTEASTSSQPDPLVSSSLRTNSLVIAGYPWESDGLTGTTYAEFFEDDASLKSLAKAVDAFEINFAQRLLETEAPLRQHLILGPLSDSAALVPYKAKPHQTRKVYTDLTVLLSLFRLLDIALKLKNREVNVPIPLHAKLELPKLTFRNAVHLSDCQSTLMEARVYFESKKQMEDMSFDAANVHVQSLRFLDYLKKSTKGFQIFWNLHDASTHLRYLMTHDFSLDNSSDDSNVLRIPDIPENMDLLYLPSDSNLELTVTEQKKFIDLIQDCEPVGFHLPLQIALFVSPIFLLVPIKLALHIGRRMSFYGLVFLFNSPSWFFHGAFL